MIQSINNLAGRHIVLAGGGTAGHLMPGIAVAKRLAEKYPGVKITFAGTGKALERHLVATAGFAYLNLPAQPFPRRLRDTLRFVTDNVTGYYSASWFLRSSGASLVIGLGGYASVPMCRAAARSGVPYILLEQNFVPGRATRYLASRASSVCTSFVEASAQLKRTINVEYTGNPIDSRLCAAAVAPRANRRARRLLVLGGSNGSQSLNEQVPRALYKARDVIADWQIIHQTGPRDLAATRALYPKLGLKAYVTPFIDDLPPILLETDLVISRAGGTTLAELAAAAVPSILVPYPAATENHQRKNADVFAARRAARVIDPRELLGRLDDAIAVGVLDLAGSAKLRARMSALMHGLAKTGATDKVVETIESVLAPEAVAIASSAPVAACA